MRPRLRTGVNLASVSFGPRQATGTAAMMAALIGVAISHGQWKPVLFVTTVCLLVILLPKMRKIGVVISLLLFPFSLGTIAGVPSALVWEVAGIPLGIAVFLRTRGEDQRGNAGMGVWLAGLAVVLFGGVTVGHFLAGALGQVFSGSLEIGASGLRPLLHVLSGTALFLASLLFVKHYSLGPEETRGVLSTVALVAVFLAALRVFALIRGVETPLVDGVYDYSVMDRLRGGLTALRVGGLSESVLIASASMVGIASVRPIKRGWTVLFVGWALSMIVLAAGRTFTLGLLLALFLVGLASHRMSTPKAITAIIAVMCLLLVAGSLVNLPGVAGQIARITSVQGGIQQQDPLRAEVNKWLWASFVEHPVFGKGLGVPVEGVWEEFVREQLVSGGHSGYLSLLANFGVFGLTLVAAIAWIPLFGVTRRIWTSSGAVIGPLDLALLFVLAVRVVEMIAGGNGYSDPVVWIAGGAYWGLKASEGSSRA